MKSVITPIILILTLLLLIPLSLAQSNIMLDCFVEEDGTVLFTGSGNEDPLLYDIEFSDGTLVGISQVYTSKDKETWAFEIRLQDYYEEYAIKVILPNNAILLTNTIDSSSDPSVYTDKGIEIRVYGKNHKPYLKFNYELGEKKSEFPWWIFIVLGIVVIVILIIFFLRKKKSKKEKPKEENKSININDLLNEREKLIIKTLKQEGGKLTQTQIQKITEIPKAALSRHIKRLEIKNLIEKRGKGKLNDIILKS